MKSKNRFPLVACPYTVDLAAVEHLFQKKGSVDLHRETAAKMFGIKPEEVTEEQRRAGKTANLYLLYGGKL